MWQFYKLISGEYVFNWWDKKKIPVGFRGDLKELSCPAASAFVNKICLVGLKAFFATEELLEGAWASLYLFPAPIERQLCEWELIEDQCYVKKSFWKCNENFSQWKYF